MTPISFIVCFVVGAGIYDTINFCFRYCFLLYLQKKYRDKALKSMTPIPGVTVPDKSGVPNTVH